MFYCPILLLFRAGVREMLCACGLWSINILIIAGRTASEQARAALLSDATLGYAFVGRAELADVAAFSDDQLLELSDVLTGRVPGRTRPDQLTLYKNNAGQGVADVAIAARVYQRARERGLGFELPLGLWASRGQRQPGA